MKHLHRTSLAFSILVACLGPLSAQESDEETKDKIEAPSPDGKYAFRYGHPADSDSDADADTDDDSDSEIQTYDLIEKESGKRIKTVAKSDPDIGPSARFNMDVLWRPDSKAFAITATFWKRGSEVIVLLRDRANFREIKIPELDADIPDKIKKGKRFDHVSELNSQTATKWQKDGSLVVEVESIVDGNDQGLSITANRTAVLAFDQSDKAKVLKSTIKFKVAKPEDQ